MVELLKELCAIDGVSGDESKVSDYIESFAKQYADEVTIDVMGNVLVYKKGAKASKERIVICAHMDEVGLVVTHITDDGYLKIDNAGEVDERIVLGKAVRIGKYGTLGVIGFKPAHLVKPEDKDKSIPLSELFVDIGAKSREDAEKLVMPGDTCAFETDISEFGDGYIRSKAIDDRFGCVALLELIKSDLPVDCMFAFTAQEEVGARGAYTAAYSTAPDIAIIVEGTSAADLPSSPGNKKVCKVGQGVVIPFMDGGAIYNKEIFGCLTGLAEKNGIPWQTKTYVAGVTDASVFQKSRSGIKVAGIAAPIGNLHSQSCVGKITDMEAVIKLLRLFLAERA